jgi:hypothetical protein
VEKDVYLAMQLLTVPSIELVGVQLPLGVLSLSSGKLVGTGFGESSPFFRNFSIFSRKA